MLLSVSTIGLSGTPSLWIFGEPHIRSTLSRVGHKKQYWSFVIFPSFSSVFSILITYASNFLVGVFFSFSYVALLLVSLVIFS